MSPTYAESKKDWGYLQSLAELVDQVEEVDWFEGLLENPTKTKANELYRSRIETWFEERLTGRTGKIFASGEYTVKPAILDARTQDIADRHLCAI
jgi:hypothetical protein